MKTFNQYLQEAMTVKKRPTKYSHLFEGTQQAKSALSSGKLTKEQFELLKKIDPTGKINKFSYVDMIYSMVKQDTNQISKNKEKLQELVALYHEAKETLRITVEPISNFTDFNAFSKYMENELTPKMALKKASQKSKGGNTQLFDPTGLKLGQDYDLIKDEPNYAIYAIHTHKAACSLGRASAWCITRPDNDHHWNNYHGAKEEEFLVIFDKDVKNFTNDLSDISGKGRQQTVKDGSHSHDMLAVHGNADTMYNDLTYTDKGDNEIDPDDFLGRIGLTSKQVKDIFSKVKWKFDPKRDEIRELKDEYFSIGSDIEDLEREIDDYYASYSDMEEFVQDWINKNTKKIRREFERQLELDQFEGKSDVYDNLIDKLNSADDDFERNQIQEEIDEFEQNMTSHATEEMFDDWIGDNTVEIEDMAKEYFDHTETSGYKELESRKEELESKLDEIKDHLDSLGVSVD